MVALLSAMDSVSVLVVGEDAASRNGLIQLLVGEAGARISGGLSPSDLLTSVPADVYAWQVGGDLQLGMRQFRAHAGNVVPALALVERAEHAATLLAAGARGVMAADGLRDHNGPTRLIAGLRATAMGFVVNDMVAVRPYAPPLTTREAEVVKLLAEGHPNKIIADKLHISEHTAKFHVNALIHKLNAQSRTDVVARAMRAGLLTV